MHAQIPFHCCSPSRKLGARQADRFKTLTMRAGEVASGILTNQGVSYLVVVGEMTKEDAQGPDSGKTSILDLASGKWTLGDARPYVGHHHASGTALL